VYWNGYNRYPASIQDGTSNTIFFTEKYSSCSGFWPDWSTSIVDASWGQPTGPASIFQVTPRTTSVDCTRASAGHTSGINAGLGDGSVRFVSQGVSGTTWWFALTINGGEVMPPDW
jgi:hypothetical protein